MEKLSSNSVGNVFRSCLFSEDELTESGLPASAMVKVEAVADTYGFSQANLETVKDNIIELLMQLSESFFKGIGDGDSFLNAVRNDRGIVWTKSQVEVDQLLALGLGIGVITYSLPRDMWAILPGGMPYFTINMDKIDVISALSEQEKADSKVREAIREAKAKMSTPTEVPVVKDEAPKVAPKVIPEPVEEVIPEVIPEPVEDFTDEILALSGEIAAAKTKLSSANIKVSAAQSKLDVTTRNESDFKIKRSNQIEAKTEEESKTKYVASKAKILLDSSSNLLINAKNKLKSAQQAVTNCIADTKGKQEAFDRLTHKAEAASTVLVTLTESLDAELVTMTEFKTTAQQDLTNSNQFVTDIDVIIKSKSEELSIIQSKQISTSDSFEEFETVEMEVPGSAFETVEVDVPDPAFATIEVDVPDELLETIQTPDAPVVPTVPNSNYGTFTQIAIGELIDKLPEKAQAIIKLYHYKKMSPVNIIAEVNTNKGSITKAVNKFTIELDKILSKNLG